MKRPARYVAYVPLSADCPPVPVVRPYEFRDEGERAIPYQADNVTLYPVGIYDTEREALAAALNAWPARETTLEGARASHPSSPPVGDES